MSKAKPKAKPPRRRPGAPTKCTLRRCRVIARQIKRGASLTIACGAAGITDRTLENWEKWAGQGKAPYNGFFRALKRAIQNAIRQAEQKVFAGTPGWQGAARWLQAMQSQRWGHWIGHEPPPPVTPPTQIHVNVDLGRQLTSRMAQLSELPPAPGLRGLPPVGEETL